MQERIGNFAQSYETNRQSIRDKLDGACNSIRKGVSDRLPAGVSNKLPEHYFKLESGVFWDRFIFYSSVSLMASFSYNTFNTLDIGTNSTISLPHLSYLSVWAFFQGSGTCHFQRSLENDRNPVFNAANGYLVGLCMLITSSATTALGNTFARNLGSVVGFQMSDGLLNTVGFIATNAAMATVGCDKIKPKIAEALDFVIEKISDIMPASSPQI